VAGDEDCRSAVSDAVVDEILAAIGRGGVWARPAIRLDKRPDGACGDGAHPVNEAGLNSVFRPCPARRVDVPATDSRARH